MVKSILLGAIPAKLRTVHHQTSSTAAHSSTTVGEEEGDNRDKSLKSLLVFTKVDIEALEKTEISERRSSNRNAQPNYGDYQTEVQNFFITLYNRPNIGIILIASDIWKYIIPTFKTLKIRPLPILLQITSKSTVTKPLKLKEK
ncbi:hypothetical protein DOY81_007583 [Sarcophaga bullata]|nr:hypothetical protein DOY81_007583 [Sarcophaga bullata]